MWLLNYLTVAIDALKASFRLQRDFYKEQAEAVEGAPISTEVCRRPARHEACILRASCLKAIATSP